MVERRVCTFCGAEIEPGTGRMYVKKDGVTHNFCSSKCFKNLIELGRVPRRITWTRYYEREKQVRLKSAKPEAPAKKRKVKKPKAEKEEKPAPEADEKVEAAAKKTEPAPEDAESEEKDEEA
jgi:large subunit ribosomal protein L24e